jgi:hypothetical protein
MAAFAGSRTAHDQRDLRQIGDSGGSLGQANGFYRLSRRPLP